MVAAIGQRIAAMPFDMTRRGFLLAAGASTAEALGPYRETAGNASTKKMDRRHIANRRSAAGERPFGTAVRPDQLDPQSPMSSIILGSCDFIVPEYHSQWSAVEWERGNPWFGNVDAIVAFAGANNMRVRGHSLIWEQMTPDWARSAMLEERDWRTVQAHFSSMLSRYGDQIPEWIVVNECIDTEHGHANLRQNSFQRAFGNEYVHRAFESARELAPGARLLINEYGLEYDNPTDEARRTALLRLVEKLKHDGAPLDGVGIQAHLDLSKGKLVEPVLARFYSELSAMDVSLEITELDVLEADRTAPVAVRDARVAAETRAFLEIALAQPRLRSTATWGLSDRHSWLQDLSDKTKRASQCSPIDCTTINRGLPLDGRLSPKPMSFMLPKSIA
jgi:endo-1,4-beta-xylanase